MADDNKISLDLEISEKSLEVSFGSIDQRAEKSAKESAAVFGEYFQKQEQDLQDSISRIVKTTKDIATKSAEESARAFQEAFSKQDAIYKASVKQNLDNAIKAITGTDQLKKSAAESASVFSDAFDKGILRDSPFDSIKNSLKGIDFTKIAAGIFLIREAAKVSFEAVKFGLDLIIQGEKEIKLDKTFSALATQAGIASDAIKNELTKSVDGFVGESELLQIANQAFVTLGNNARQLPQVIELARKTYSVFGGSIVDNTNAITNAIATGQTRQLKQLGIIVDTQKVYKEYAASIGTVVPLLSEQQRQQALLNAILDQGSEKFKNVKLESGTATDAFLRLKVQVGELGDEFKKFTATKLGEFFADAAKGAADFLRNLNQASAFVSKPTESLEKINFQINLLEKNIQAAKDQLAQFNAVERFFLGGDFEESIKKNSAALLEYQKKLAEAQKAQAAATQAAGQGGAPQGGQADEEFVRRKQELVSKVQDLNNQLNASEVKLSQERFAREQSVANFEILTYQQRQAAAQDYLLKKSQLEKFFADNGIIDEALRNQAREALEQTHVNNLLAIDQQAAFQRENLRQQELISIYNSSTQIQNALKNLAVNAGKEGLKINKVFSDVAKASKAALVESAGQAFAAFGAALVNGGNAAEEFGKVFLSAIGQVLVQLGQGYILQGIAASANPLTPGAGAGLITAGIALSAFGGVLSALGGGGRGAGGGGGATAIEGGGTTGGGFTETSPINESVAPEDTVAQTPKTEVQVVINGNVLDRRETGLEIAQILQEQFQDQGLIIRGAV